MQRGSRYHDGKPGEPGKDWWGTVTGFQPPGSVDFQHTIHVRQLAATIDVHIHYSLEQQGGETAVSRWLVLDIKMPLVFRPLRPLVTASFDKENLRTMAALQADAVAQRRRRRPSAGERGARTRPASGGHGRRGDRAHGGLAGRLEGAADLGD